MDDYRLESLYNFTKVLIIEDILYSKRSLAKDFRDIDCFVISAKTGKETIEKIIRYDPDIITISHDLIDISVKVLISEIIKYADRETTKLILVSTRKSTDTYTNLVDAVVTLPIDKKELQNRVMELIP